MAFETAAAASDGIVELTTTKLALENICFAIQAELQAKSGRMDPDSRLLLSAVHEALGDLSQRTDRALRATSDPAA